MPVTAKNCTFYFLYESASLRIGEIDVCSSALCKASGTYAFSNISL
jgi:hypothetical protein